MASVPADEQQRQLLQLAAERLLNGDRARQASASNYDFGASHP